MRPAGVPRIGARIRVVRTRRGLTVRGLAREVGVSASLISQIETEKARPSVGTLYAITNALDIAVDELLGEVDQGYPQGGSGLPEGGQHGAEVRRVGPRVRPQDRETITLDSGVSWQLLGQVPDVHTEFLRVTYPPGSSSAAAGRLMRHAGTEYGFLLSGQLVLTLAFEEQLLEPGDSVCFESATPHAYRNDGPEPAVGIWFVRED